MADPLEQLSDSDLEALSRNDLHSMTDEGLRIVATSGKSSAPAASSPEPSMLASGARQAISGFAGGFDDEASGALSAAGRVAGVKNLGTWKPFSSNSHLELASPTLDPEKLTEAYRENRDFARKEQQTDIAAHPVVSTAANVGGMIANPLLRAASPAGMGAIQGLGNSNADLTKGEVVDAAKDTAIGAAEGYGAGKLGQAAAGGLAKFAQKPVEKVAQDLEPGFIDALGNPIKTFTDEAPQVQSKLSKIGAAVKEHLSDAASSALGAYVAGPFGAAAGPYIKRAAGSVLETPIAGVANGLSRIVKDSPALLGKWGPVLVNASKRGDAALNASAYVLQQQDPDFRQRMMEINNAPSTLAGDSRGSAEN